MRVVDTNFNQAALTGVSKSTQGFLVFTTQEAYDNVLGIIKDFSDEQLNGWEDALVFTSAFTAYAEPTVYNVNPQDNKNQGFEDDLFSRILDVNGLIQIEGFVFKAAFDNNYLLEMNQSHLATHYTMLKAGTFDVAVMNKFDGSFDDSSQDIFELLRTNVTGTTPIGSSSFLKPQFKNKPAAEDLTDDAQTIWRAECKSAYQSMPLYHSLMGEMKYSKKVLGTGVFWSTKTQIDLYSSSSSCWFKPNRRGMETKTVRESVFDNKQTYRPYAASRGLEGFGISLYYNYYSIIPGTRVIHTYTSK